MSVERRSDCNTGKSSSASPTIPFVYQWDKPGRRNRAILPAKATFFYGENEPILAIAWRSQQGTTKAVSLPRPILLHAQALGVKQVYLRNDNAHFMRRASVGQWLRGRLQPDGEHYLLLADMEPVAWRPWYYASDVYHIAWEPVAPQPDSQPSQPVQLSLFGAVGA